METHKAGHISLGKLTVGKLSLLEWEVEDGRAGTVKEIALQTDAISSV